MDNKINYQAHGTSLSPSKNLLSKFNDVAEDQEITLSGDSYVLKPTKYIPFYVKWINTIQVNLDRYR